MSTNAEEPPRAGRRLTPADVRSVRFARASMLHPGYQDTQVDSFLSRVAEEINVVLNERVDALGGAAPTPAASTPLPVGPSAPASPPTPTMVREGESRV